MLDTYIDIILEEDLFVSRFSERLLDSFKEYFKVRFAKELPEEIAENSLQVDGFFYDDFYSYSLTALIGETEDLNFDGDFLVFGYFSGGSNGYAVFDYETDEYCFLKVNGEKEIGFDDLDDFLGHYVFYDLDEEIEEEE